MIDAASLQAACDSATGWPLPGGGGTASRWAGLVRAAQADLVLGRLVEAHADAAAICAELGGPPVQAGQRWGVWAANAPGARLVWADGLLAGSKAWCSGATLCTHALVSAQVAAPAGQEQGLFAVDLAQPGARPEPPSWVGAGMAAADTRTVGFDQVPARSVGAPGSYLSRPGFWHGAMGVAACWYGGALAVADPLRQRVRKGADAHTTAHLGAVHTALAGAGALLADSAAQVDAGRGDALVSRTVRSGVEAAAREVLDRVGRALGPGPLAMDARHAGLVADLTVYLRQHHAERDLEALGHDVAADQGDRLWPT